jgi:biotin carboxyl carrier protein
MEERSNEMMYEMIMSPCHGTIEKISIEENSRIYEWEPLFIIKTMNGDTQVIRVGLSGEVKSLEVAKGDEVIPGMVLAYIKEDLLLSGSD